VTRVWYCANCGYEVHSRGRCHACRERLVASAVPELESASEDDEVGYRIDGWTDRDRGRLIVRLNDLGIEHRFEEDELVVDAADEARVDDLVALLGDSAEAGLAEELGADPAAGWADLDGGEGDEAEAAAGDDGARWDEDPDMAATVRLLADAATRLRMDPTDMQADADVAEASAAVFVADRFGPFDESEWSAVGRVTRRLLAALGAEEALEEDIRRQAGVLEKLLGRLGATPTAVAAGEADQAPVGERTVYELAEWLPDQRAQLGYLLEEAGIPYEWEGDDLLVPSEHEDGVEALFDLVAGGHSDDDEGDEERYRVVAELFAACGRLAGDPTDETRQDAVLGWIEDSEGPPLLGMDEVVWFRLRSRARVLAVAIEEGHDPNELHELATELHDMLRAVV